MESAIVGTAVPESTRHALHKSAAADFAFFIIETSLICVQFLIEFCVLIDIGIIARLVGDL
jgi:hypothetical protein